MEPPNPAETLIEGLATFKQGGNANVLEERASSINLGEDKCAEPVSVSPPVAENVSGVNLSSHADVHMKGISLFVELTGDLKQHGSSNRNQGEIIDAYKQCGVNVGGLVWAMIRKQTWWPGIVCEASSVQIRENGILVRCFGNGNYIWCHPDELKPFIQHFEQLSISSNQRKSKIFFSAIDEALSEVGNRVKKEFTCPCFSKVVERKVDPDVDNHDVSLTRFDPATFFDYVKDLATDVSSVNKTDYAINQSFLSAFNCSLGHYQVPVHQLKSPSKIKTEDENGFEGSFGKSEKGNETRERRKSRYLSYPGEEGTEEVKKDDNGGMELNKSNGGMELKKPKKKYSKKVVVVKQDFQLPPNVCSSEVLSKLQSAAQDCVFPSESKNFDSIERFVAGFRKWVFSDSPTNGIKQTPESEKPKRVRKKKIKSSPSVILDFQNANSVVHEPQLMAKEMTKPPLRKLLPKRSLNNMDNNTPTQPWNSNSIPTPMPNVNGHMDMDMNMVPMNPFLFHPIDGSNQATFEFGSPQPWLVNHGPPQVSMVNHEPKKRGRKRKHVEKQIHPQASDGLTTVTPDLTENANEKKRGKKGKKKETGVPCIDLTYNKVNQENTDLKGTAFLLKFSPNYPLPSTHNLNLVFSKYGELNLSETFISIENLSGQVVFENSSSAGGAFWGLQNDQPFGPALVNYRIQHLNNTEPIEFKTPIKPPMSLSKPQGQDGKPDPHTHSPGVTSPYMIPDLNGYANETKTKKVEEIRLPSMDSRKNGDEVSGTVLMLKFSPCHPVPTIQDLNSVFCKYGLNESETWVNTGQDLTGQVVFVNPLRVGEAVENLEKERPFGDSVLSFRVQHLYTVKPAITPIAVKTTGQGQPGQDIGVIRKNLEMMRCMLEKGGGGLSGEVRGKLEREIRGLMNKVSGMDGCCSSSSL